MSQLPPLEVNLGAYGGRVEARLDRWRSEATARRLLERDRTIWFEESVPELENRLGWLDLPFAEPPTLSDWVAFASNERAAGLSRVVVLGMGGSSLAPEVYQRTFGDREEFVVVLDSTHPDAVSSLESELDFATTLFVVSSKSGSTIETRSLFEYFWSRVSAEIEAPGSRFVVITDEGSSLESLAHERQVHRLFHAPSDVGGRYSALTAFGLVPGALAGLDLEGLIARARGAAEMLRDEAAATDLLRLGAILGELANSGRDKLTLWTSPSIAAFPSWLEQLVAESTGKEGRGILPVVGDSQTAGEGSNDRVYVALLVEGDGEESIWGELRRLSGQGLPTVSIRLSDPLDIGAEIFRWEVAVGLAGSVLGINPFSQPNVQLAKRLAKEALDSETEATGPLRAMPSCAMGPAASTRLEKWLASAAEIPYFSVQLYGPRTEASERALLRLQSVLSARTHRVTTVGFGPRFLHSTGQLHKGGPADARFLQIVVGWTRDLPIPGETVSFGELMRAQADGDAGALLASGQQVLRVELAEASEIERVVETVEELA
jgi:transaldolase/glucose-6-phosphate isomerase